MSRRGRQLLLLLFFLLFGIVLIIFLLNRDLANDPVPPRELVPMAAWLAKHPADWLTASLISEAALDSTVPQRIALWRSAYAVAHRLSPRHRNASAAFVRAGLFHWYELSDNDRAAILAAAGPLLRDPQVFNELHQPLWELTRNLGWLRRHAPENINALYALHEISIRYGLFAAHRELRAEMKRASLRVLETQKERLSVRELMQLVPRRVDTEDEPLVRGVLAELARRSYAPAEVGDIEPLLEYALRHQIQPIAGLSTLVDATKVFPAPTRARIALALNQPDVATGIALSASTGAPEWIPYQLERALFEARRGDAKAAEHQLSRARVARVDARVLDVARQVATLLGQRDAAQQSERALLAIARQPPQWEGACGPNELCDRVVSRVYSTGEIALDFETAQSDQTPPYIEIYVDDARVAEGEVNDARRFVIGAAPGVHRVDVRLINFRMRNGAQRRVRMSRSTTATAAPRIAARVAGFEGMKKLKSYNACTMAMVRLIRAAA